MGAVEGGQRATQHAVGDVGTGEDPDRHRPAGRRGAFAQTRALLEHQARFLAKPFAGGGEDRRRAPPPEEQGRTQVSLQRTDMAADGRLGHAEALGGPGEIAVAGRVHEDLELPQGVAHGGPPSSKQ